MRLISFNIDDQISDFKRSTNKKNLLFDHGCKNNFYFERNNSKKNYIVANVFQKSKKNKRINELQKLDKIYSIVLKHISTKLNRVHKKNYNIKFWEIMITQWLTYALRNAHARWTIFEEINKKYKVTDFARINLDEKLFITENTESFRLLQTSNFGFNKDLKKNHEKRKYNLYDHLIIAKIVEFKSKKIKIEKINLRKNIDLKKKMSVFSRPLSFSRFFFKSLNNNIFFYNLQLPLKFKIKLMLIYKFICYQLKPSKKIVESRINFNRGKIFETNSKKKNFINFFKGTIKFTLPKIFLENFEILNLELKKLSFPKNPKYILTTYPHFDEMFKLYCAQNHNKSKFFLFQHGYDNIFKFENSVNKFYTKYNVSWGLNKNKYLKSFFFTKFLFNKKKDNFFQKKNIIILLTTFYESDFMDPYGIENSHNINYILYSSTRKLIDKIEKNNLDKIDIKLQEFTRFEIVKNTLKKKYNNINILGMEKSYVDLIDNYKLSIFFFTGTALFESMFLNRPSITILNKDIAFEFDDKFNHFINRFIDEKIFFTNVDDAADFLNNNYLSLEKWWQSKRVQNLVKEFCDTYCRKPENIKFEFKKLLKN
jgi:putative transferase (TIGR04331 family)